MCTARWTHFKFEGNRLPEAPCSFIEAYPLQFTGSTKQAMLLWKYLLSRAVPLAQRTECCCLFGPAQPCGESLAFLRSYYSRQGFSPTLGGECISDVRLDLASILSEMCNLALG